jgi:hypothetical protein
LALGLIVGAAIWVRAHAAQPTPQEIAACGEDAKRICSASPFSDPSKVAACLVAHRPSLSKACAALLLSEGR